mmetsp:Transcript_15539/g.31512  ORF Transcript_15539/g.31512 Transcript_15539/m.31512 type:complete len:258 (+) Transcript_15539:904-1677(+)
MLRLQRLRRPPEGQRLGERSAHHPRGGDAALVAVVAVGQAGVLRVEGPGLRSAEQSHKGCRRLGSAVANQLAELGSAAQVHQAVAEEHERHADPCDPRSVCAPDREEDAHLSAASQGDLQHNSPEPVLQELAQAYDNGRVRKRHQHLHYEGRPLLQLVLAGEDQRHGVVRVCLEEVANAKPSKEHCIDAHDGPLMLLHAEGPQVHSPSLVHAISPYGDLGGFLGNLRRVEVYVEGGRERAGRRSLSMPIATTVVQAW